jgi:hypothetical protein
MIAFIIHVPSYLYYIGECALNAPVKVEAE